MTKLGELLIDVKPGFASGDNLDAGVFQFRMHNFTRDSVLDLTKRRRVNATPKQLQSQSVAAGDVLFNSTNSPELVGKSALVGNLDEVAVFSNHFLRLRADPDRLSPRYLAHFLRFQFARGVFRAMAKSWVNQATVGRDRLEELEVPIPSLSEQRRIAAILDQADAIRAKRRQALAHLDDLAQSIFRQMFEGLPWPEESLADAVQAGTLVTYGIVQAGAEFENGVPYVRTGDIVDGRIRSEGLRRTDPKIAAKFARSTVRSGDIVMSIRATVGTTALVPSFLDGANLTQGTAKISPSSRAVGPYLLAYLRSDRAQHWIRAQVKGATFREITLGRLRELSVPLPPVDVQELFSSRVARVERLRQNCEDAMGNESDLFLALQWGAFRGES